MKTPSTIDPHDFERLLSRNLKLPLLGGLFGAVVFVGLILFLLSTISWVEHTDRVTRTASELQRRSIDMETGMRGFLITGEESFLAPYQAALPRLKVDTNALRSLVSDNPQQVERVDRIAGLQEAWTEFARGMIDARRAGNNEQATVRLGSGKRLIDDMRAEFNAFMDTEQALRFQRNNDANRTSWWTVGLFLLFTLVLTGLIAYFGRRQLMRLSQSYDVVLKEQAAHAERLSEEAWLRGAQTELVGELVGELSAPDMGRKILAFFSRHLDSAVGALYVRERHGPLRRAASYGFSEVAEASPQVLSPTASLVGQAAAERRRMLIDPVDADYLKINSGLGEMPPKAVLLIPVMSDGIVNGVIELGLPGAPDERASQLLDVVCDDIGTSLAAARYREQLQDVLTETQQLNEELQVQQEELRTANEELEEQSRALRASQAMLENQQAELEQTNSQLSERTEALDQRNTALRRVQRDLEDRANELQRASRYKSEFLANMSHELRTPLNSALILAKLLGDNPQGNLSLEQVKFAESIYASGNDLLVLINDILDIAKVEAGKLDLVPEDVVLAKLAQMEAIYLKYSYDFRNYTLASQKRRVLYALTQLDLPSISALQDKVLRDTALFGRLLQFLTIPVSEMFRDPAYFLALRQHVVPILHTYPSVKVWMAGCSTGEEVFSLAILLREEGLLERTQIYATDINPASLEKARLGIFPLESSRGYTANYQRAGGKSAFSDYYTAAYEAARFDPSLCADVIFADHSLATDSVFVETQLVSCRNVLIYFNRELQDRALGLFHESLSHRGFLGLGSKESIDFSGYSDRFETHARAERIYRKT